MSARLAAWLVLLALVGCASVPQQVETLDFRARAETQAEGGVRVSAAVLSPLESEAAFSMPLAREGIQPVWIEVENQQDRQLYFMLLSLDPDYFSPYEVAWQFRSYGKESLEDRATRLLALHVPVIIPPQGTVSGYVYTNLDPGAKAFAVELFGEGIVRSFEFAQAVPGFEADYMQVDFEHIYADEEVRRLRLDELRDYLERLPCCVAGGDKKTPGEPLNLVMVGEARHAIATLVSRGWDLTETTRGDTAWRTMISSLYSY